MAIGPSEREALRSSVHGQYKDQSIAAMTGGLDLALRGFELSRRRLDNNALTWEQYVPLRGHYNATVNGILDALNEKGLTPKTAQLWKKTHAVFWTELEEPPYMAKYCKDLFQQLMPHLVVAHSGLKALNNLLISFKEKGGDPKNAAVIRSSVESNTTAMSRAGFGIQVRALRGIHGFDEKTDFSWMEKYIPKLSAPAAAVEATVVSVPLSTAPKRPKGLQKSAPAGMPGDFDDAPVGSAEPVGEDWEEALGTLPGSVPSAKKVPPSASPTPSPTAARPKGLQKSSSAGSPFDIDADSFGM